MVALQHAPAQAVNPEPEITALLCRNGLCRPEETPRGEALAGGVSSDIWRVDLARGPVCVKRALPRLRVAQLWEAPVGRNRYEYEWLRIAGEVVPGAAPNVLFRDESAFVMEYLDPAAHPVWKNELREGRADPQFAARVGDALAAIHAATGGRADVAAGFPTDDIFYAIRLEPYLIFTGSAHPDLARELASLAATTAQTKACLVHGDVSPKNILCGPRGPVFLDAECAWYGDPAFDLAFCLNHLLLKCVWVPRAREGFLECFRALSSSYLERFSPANLEERSARLLPALLLARVDGKSPVEYLDEAGKAFVRARARAMFGAGSLTDAWRRFST
jgi:aminoglycoside phosphotransferase (APT) family kinase protein